MAKPIPKVGSRRNGRSSARKSARRILKGVIHVQASFNNTIVTVTDVRGRVISWSSIGTCGFKGNVIQAIVEQGMQRAEVMVKGPSLERDAALRPIVEVNRHCDAKSFAWRTRRNMHYTCKSKKIPHEYSTIVGIQESIHEILMNLKEIVLKGNLYETCNSFICAKGPGYVTVQDIILPPSMEIVDNTQHVASLTEPIDLLVKLIKMKNEIALKYIFIDQSKLPPKIYNCLKKSNIHTLLDLLNNSREDLMKIEHFHIEDVKQILGILEKK
ncbi:hypothetical protein ES319_D08G156500v1 [Gossypium barbadense]|uniref:Plastid-encoded RNA polymerase subunit alpha n=1 Tax=Gossypium barbadense TaxID=3634 RepID=A0A5J5QGJ4_GOSBA|nr:hypothetical protein ES319_D08G156500v1 [Gossypium barbadense]